MQQPRFTTYDLLLAVTMVGIGLAYDREALVGVYAPAPAWRFAYWLIGGATIGAGILAPFRLKLLGAVLGIAVQLALFAALKRMGY